MTGRIFYGEDLAWVHDRYFGDLARAAAEFVVDSLAGHSLRSGTVVDLGCGSGILARIVSAAGFEVAGWDVSPAMIEIARSRAPSAVFTLGSLEEASFPDRCVAVCAVGEVLNYAGSRAPDGWLVGLARRIHASLVPGGIFVFDIASRGRHGKGHVHEVVHDHEDWTLVMRAVEDTVAGTLRRHISVFRRTEGNFYRRSDEEHDLAIISGNEIGDILAAAGFQVKVVNSYESGSLATAEHGWSAFVATKPGTP